jgi:hypothetical protein
MAALPNSLPPDFLASFSPSWFERGQRLATGKATQADLLWAQPWRLLKTPDPWQKQVLTERWTNWIVTASRGSGKSSVAAAAMYLEAVIEGKFVLVLSASGDQVRELHRRFAEMYQEFPVVKGEVLATQAEFANGGRVLTRKAKESTARGFHGVSLLVMDESSRISDELSAAIGPSIAISKGRKMAISTPFGKRGWFYENWCKANDPQEQSLWKPMFRPWRGCPRITPAIVENYRQENGDDMVRQEFECEFLGMANGSPFCMERWERMLCEMEDEQ